MNKEPKLEDRRQWPRQLDVNRAVELQITRAATIVDESPAGLGLLLPEMGDLKIDEQVEINEVDGIVRLTGRVANIQQMSSGQWRIGVELASYHLPSVYEEKG